MGQKGGFNWAQNLFEIQEAINLIPKDVLGKRTPSEVYAARSNATMQQEVQAASQRSSDRMTKRLSKHLHLSVYRKGEHVLLKFPTGGSRLAPRRRYTCKGVVEERNLVQNKYKVRFVRLNGTKDSQWVSVSNITSVTVRKEKQAAKRTVSEELRKDQHRQKYCIPVTHKDRIEKLNSAQEGLKVLLDPQQSPGNCQFESISHQLTLFGIHRTSQTLRQEAVGHIQDFPALYNDFIVGDSAKYISDMTKERTYGDHLTLLAMSRLYNVQFLIASADGPEYAVLVSPDGTYSNQTFLLTLGYFPEDRGEHYVSIAIESRAKTELLSHACTGGQQSQVFVQPSEQNDHGHGQCDLGEGQWGCDAEQCDSDERQCDSEEGQFECDGEFDHDEEQCALGQSDRDEQCEREQGQSDSDEQCELEQRQSDSDEQCEREQRQSDSDEQCEREQGQSDSGEQCEREQGQSDPDEECERDQGQSDPDEQCEREQGQSDQACSSREFLPREVQLVIIHHALRVSPASRYTLRLVNSFFRDAVAMILLPQLHSH